MSDLQKKLPEPDLTDAEKKIVKDLFNSDVPGLLKAVGIAAAALMPLQRHFAAAEAAKLPAQRAREAQAREIAAAERARKKAEQQAAKRAALYRKWCLHDTWLLQNEAVPLFFGEQPTSFLLVDGVEELSKLAVSCADHSLKIVNATEARNKWRVNPGEWVRWLKEKGIAVNAELVAATQPKLPPLLPLDQPQTAKATKTREQRKAARIHDLKAFLNVMDERARSHGWNRKNIPVTKADFLDVFKKQYPQYRDLRPASFDNDFTEVGAKFSPGVKRSKTNVLKKLFGVR